MQTIPLVRSRYVFAFGAVLDRLGAPKRRLLEEVGLSERILEAPETVISARQAWAFIGRSAQSEGIADFGLMAGDTSIQNYGAFSDRLLIAPNLYQAMKIFCELALNEYSRADFYVSLSKDTTWFCRGPIDGNEEEVKHVELLVLTMMIATVRMVAGPNWHPPVVLLQTNDTHLVQQHHLCAHSNIRFGNRVTAFKIPNHLLARELPILGAAKVDQDYDRLEHEFPVAIRQIVLGMLVDGPPKIATVADAVGGSVRTLQRRLADINMTFSDIVEGAKMKSAIQMVDQSDCTFTDISHALGYSDQAHFTRAFKRWNGVSPSVYRRLKAKSTGR